MTIRQEDVDEARLALRESWRKWARKRRERLTPEQIEIAKAKAKARRAARLATPEGREKHREIGRKWRQSNSDKVRAHRDRQNAAKREKTAARRAALMADPDYVRALEERKALAPVSEREARRRYYLRRKARFEKDPEAFAEYRARQKKYRDARQQRIDADPVLRAAYLQKIAEKNASRRKSGGADLSDHEREERARRRREERAKKQRLLNAKNRAEREARKAEEPAPAKAEPARRQFPVRKMGRLTALMKWHGR